MVFMGFAWATSLGIFAQGYDTKFKAIGFKPGDVYQTDEGVSVSLNGGGLEVALPLGPPLPGPIPIQPTILYHGKLSQSLNPHPPRSLPPDTYDPAHYMLWNPPSLPAASLSPGKLFLALGSSGSYGDDADAGNIVITTPSGQRSEYVETGPGMKKFTAADAPTLVPLMTALVTPDEWPYAATWGTSATGTVAYRTSDHSTIVFGPQDHQICYSWDQFTNPDGTRRDTFTFLPAQILQITKDQTILWQHSRNVYKPVRNDQSTVAEQWWWRGSVYHPVWIKHRSGFKVDVAVSRYAPKERTDLVESGLIKGWTVSYKAGNQTVGFTVDASSATPIAFTGMADAPNVTGLYLSGATPRKVTSYSSGWQPGTTYGYETLGAERQYDVEYMSDELSAGFSTFTQGALSTSAEWNGPGALLSKLVTPRGKMYRFTYEMRQGVGVRPSSNGNVGSWIYDNFTGSMDFWSVVTQMDVSDSAIGDISTRTTKYQWAIPVATTTQWSNPYPWVFSSKSQGVAQTMPDGQTILHVHASPLDVPAPGAPALGFPASTFLAMRQAVVARYYYPAGDTSWQGFFVATPIDLGTTNWFKRERMEGWDLRAWETTVGQISTNSEPRPTRIITELKAGPVTVAESDDWDFSNNQYRVKRTYILAPGASPASQAWAPGSMTGLTGAASYQATPGLAESATAGAQAHSVSATTFAVPAEGLFARPDQVQEKQILAPATGSAGPLVPVKYVYDATAGRAHVVTRKSQLATDASGAHIDLNYSYQPAGLFSVNRLKEVLLTATAPNQAAAGHHSGETGASYAYDATGRWMTSIQLRRNATSFYPWSEQEPSHDDMGRPLTQTDPNGISVSYTWDEFGRLTSAAPAAPEKGTILQPDNSLRKVTVNRGAQQSIYHFNAFAELIAEQRISDAGSSHKLYGYDPAGRKTWESVWRPGAPSLTAWTGTLPEKGTLWAYDGRSRVTLVTNPNGEAVRTLYEVGGNPLVTQRVVAPGTADESATTLELDALGRLAKVTTSPDGDLQYVTTYKYDAAGRILQALQVNPVTNTSQTRTWSYDGLGRLTALEQPESGRTEFTAFTASGSPTVTTYGAGSASPKVVNSTFDSLGRLLSLSSNDGTIDQAFTYDEDNRGASLGKLTSSRDGSVTTQRTYGELNGRISAFNTINAGTTFTQSYSYDSYGRRTQAVVDGRKILTAFDDPTGLATQVTYFGNGSPVGGTSVLSSVVNDWTLWLPAQLKFGNGASTLFGYRDDQAGLAMIAHYAAGSGGPAQQWSYSYNSAGNLKTDGEDLYQYDLLGRLKQASVKRFDGSTVTQAFAYDAFGNRLSSSASGNVPATVMNVAFSPLASELNQRNQLPAQTNSGVLTGAAYDPQGSLTSIWAVPGDSATQLGFANDALGRVIQLSDAKRPGFMEKYSYSTDGLRTRIEEYLNGVLVKTRYNVYNDLRQLVSKYRK